MIIQVQTLLEESFYKPDLYFNIIDDPLEINKIQENEHFSLCIVYLCVFVLGALFCMFHIEVSVPIETLHPIY